LFLYYAPKLVHYPLQAPMEYPKKFSFIEEDHRRMYAAMVNFLDDQVGNVTQKFRDLGMWNDTLMVLSSDNGGCVLGFDGNCFQNTPGDHGTTCFNGEAGGNNYPLRGGKYTGFEGGVRSNSFVSGGFLPESVCGTRLEEIIHISDWYATFCYLAGVDPFDHEAAKWGLPPVDSMNVWPLISGVNTTSPRNTILVDNSTFIHKNWKLLTGYQGGSGWTGPFYPNATSAQRTPFSYSIHCNPACLFDVVADPTEHEDLAASEPAVVVELTAIMNEMRKTIWNRGQEPDDPLCKKTAVDYWGGFYGPWQELSRLSVK